MSTRQKKIITWKDADHNLCILAASMLHQASQSLRGGRNMTVPRITTRGQQVPPGFAEVAVWTGGPARTVFTGPSRWGEGGGEYAIEDEDDDRDLNHKAPSSLCWWAFQNIVRFELRRARKLLKENLYPQTKGKKTDPALSRNKDGRRAGSKYGRQNAD